MPNLGTYVYVIAFLIVLGIVACVVRYPLISVIVLISIYIFKPITRFFMPALMVSYTYDMFALCIGYLGALVLWRKRTPGSSKLHPFPIAVIIFITIVLAMGLSYTRVPEYGFKKVLIFGVFELLSLVLPMLLLRNAQIAEDVLKWFVIFGVVLPFVMMIPGASMQGASARTTLLGANPLAPAELMNNALLVIIILVLLAPAKKIYLFGCLSIPVLMYGIAATGSRGPLVSTAIITLILLAIYGHRRIFMIAIIGTILSLVSYVVLSEFLPEKLSRRFSVEESSHSIEHRLHMTMTTIHRISQNPIVGNGPADSAMDVGKSETKGYAHTVVLEVFDEAGVPAGILYLLMILYAFYTGWRTIRVFPVGSRRHLIAVAFFALLLGKFIESFKTGSYAGSNMLYFLLGCLYAISNALRSGQEPKSQPLVGVVPIQMWRPMPFIPSEKVKHAHRFNFRLFP